MNSLKNTKTLGNLMKAFAGESQARNRYTYYASIAKKEGFNQISAIFTETADNEKEHAKRFYKLMLAGLDGQLPAKVEVHAEYPVAMASTLENLKAAAEGEREEWTMLYSDFEKIADKEGFPDVATAFRMIAKVEEKHEARYVKLAKNIADNKVFKKDCKVLWKCGNCGYIHEGEQAVDKCPACLHPQAHFELFVEAY